MGLDVTAYPRCRLLEATEGYGGQHHDRPNTVHIYTPGKNYLLRLDGQAPGYYTYRGDTFHFRAGSYTAYNEWREWLARRIFNTSTEVIWQQRERFAGQPFIALIDFPDNEGALGPETCAALVRDFADHEHILDGLLEISTIAGYQNWWTAFATAAHRGFVRLH